MASYHLSHVRLAEYFLFTKLWIEVDALCGSSSQPGRTYGIIIYLYLAKNRLYVLHIIVDSEVSFHCPIDEPNIYADVSINKPLKKINGRIYLRFNSALFLHTLFMCVMNMRCFSHLASQLPQAILLNWFSCVYDELLHARTIRVGLFTYVIHVQTFYTYNSPFILWQ